MPHVTGEGLEVMIQAVDAANSGLPGIHGGGEERQGTSPPLVLKRKQQNSEYASVQKHLAVRGASDCPPL